MPDTISNYKLSSCSDDDFTSVVKLIAEMQLDNNDLNASQFIVAKSGKELIGFGRLRTYDTCQELCSLGVVQDYRYKGVGTQISQALKEKSSKPLYAVTIIPDYFKRLGFEQVRQFPKEIVAKVNYCTGSLPVPEAYVAMWLK